MKRIIYFLLALFVVSCSIDRQEETVAIEGLDGTTTLARTFNFEGAEGICENGGLRIDFGQDANDDGILQDEEIGSTNYVCNGLDGRDGSSTLIRVVAIDGTQDCPNGGIAASTGFDINGNGVLDDAEISNTVFVCNGENGVDGENGLNALVNTLTIEEGELCEEGGFVFQSGLDTNRNGILDESEVSQEETICNGEDGLSIVYETTNVEETENCPFGGIIIEAGLDSNENGELDAEEVATSDFICNGRDGENGQDGEDGFNSITAVEDFDGGVIIKVGLDINRNNILDESEVITTTTVLDGEDGIDGENGEDGFNSLVKLDQIEPSNTFPNGGVQISSGLDTNRNTILDDNEISNIAFISNGSNGQDGQDGEDGQDGSNGLNSLINILRNTPNRDSTTVQTGIDDNNNGTLEQNEVDQEFIVRNGVDGEDGEDGEDGQDGKCSFIVVLDEPAGENCEFGGVKIITGKDDNRNLRFDDNEVDQVEYVCEYRPCVEVVEIETVFDFEIFNEGDFVSNYGVATVYGYNSRFNHNKAMIFDSNANPASGGDNDLNVNSGNILIISEDGDSSDPDDNAAGGVFTFTFKKDVTFTAIDIIDIEGRHNNIKFYDGFGNRILKEDLIVVGNKQQGTMTFNVEHVRKVVVSICESGAIDNLKFKCLQVINNCD